MKPALGTAWQYAKTEIVPPMTLNFFHGPKGKSLEDTISKAADNFISGIQNRINEIEAEKMRDVERKQAAAKALIEKLKAEAKKKAEAKRKSEEAQKRAAEIVIKAKEEAQKKSQTATKTISDVKKIVEGGKQVAKKAVTSTKRKPPAKRESEHKEGSPKTTKK